MSIHLVMIQPTKFLKFEGQFKNMRHNGKGAVVGAAIAAHLASLLGSTVGDSNQVFWEHGDEVLNMLLIDFFLHKKQNDFEVKKI